MNHINFILDLGSYRCSSTGAITLFHNLKYIPNLEVINLSN